jgi:hypothetical protein
MAWNLADQLNTDMDSESLFDSLPSAVDQLRKEEAVRVIDSGGDLNENSKGSFVSGSNIAPLEDIKTRASANSESRRVKAEETSNPLDNFEPVKQAPQPKKELTIGEIVADGYSLIGQVQKLKNGRTGANAREVAREKAIDEQFIGQVYGRMGDLFEERNMDRNLVSRLGALPGGGYRTAEEIDRVDRIRREGAVLKDDNGSEVIIEKGLDWDRAFEADKLVWAQELKSRTKAGAAGGDPIERVNKINTALKGFVGEDGKPLPGKEDVVESLYSEIDVALGAPTGRSKYLNSAARLLNQNQQLDLAVSNNISYKDTPKDQLQNKKVENIESLIQLAIENNVSPKKEELGEFIKSGSPFIMDIGEGNRKVVFPTSKPNVYNIWNSVDKNFGVLDLTPQTDKEVPQTKQSEANLTPEERDRQISEKISKTWNETIWPGAKSATKGAVKSILQGAKAINN